MDIVYVRDLNSDEMISLEEFENKYGDIDD